MRVSLKTNPDPAICPITLDSAAMAGATRVKVAEGINVVVVVVVVVGGKVLVLRRMVHAAVIMAFLAKTFQLFLSLLMFDGHAVVFSPVSLSTTVGDDKEGILVTFVVVLLPLPILVVVVVVVGRIGWKPKDTDAHGNETKRKRRNSD